MPDEPVHPEHVLRALQLRSFAEYREVLASDGGREISELCNAITTNLTSFFRESHHFDYLREHWIKTPFDYATSAHIAWDGSSVALTSRGRTFVAPLKGRFVDVEAHRPGRYREARPNACWTIWLSIQNSLTIIVTP